MEVDELKKVTASLNALYNDKVKANKPIKGKKKGANKAKLHLGKETVSHTFANIIEKYIYLIHSNLLVIPHLCVMKNNRFRFEC